MKTYNYKKEKKRTGENEPVNLGETDLKGKVREDTRRSDSAGQSHTFENRPLPPQKKGERKAGAQGRVQFEIFKGKRRVREGDGVRSRTQGVRREMTCVQASAHGERALGNGE